MTLAFDGFESKNFEGGSGWLGPWTRKGNKALLKKNPYEGKRYVKLMGGKAGGVIERRADLSNVTSARLRFANRIKSFEKEDKAYVKVSSNGVDYTVVRVFTPADSDDQYHIYDIDLSKFEMTENFRVVFEAEMNRRTTDMWFLDNIEITGVR